MDDMVNSVRSTVHAGHAVCPVKSTVTKLENTLLYQRKIQNNHTIPRKYKQTQYLQVFGENGKKYTIKVRQSFQNVVL